MNVELLVWLPLTGAHQRTGLTAAAPGFANRAAAHLLAEVPRHRQLAAPQAGHHAEALAVFGRRLGVWVVGEGLMN